jgi:Na+/phosphate symporter
VLVFLPFTNQIAKLLERYIGKDVLPSKHLTSLDFKYFDTTFVALEQVKHENGRNDEYYS